MAILTGIDNCEGLRLLRGRRLALLTNPTGVDAGLRSTAELLQERFDLRMLFGPEHGIRGDHQAGEEVEEGFLDPELEVPCYTLYGPKARPLHELLSEVDALVYDIQDVGARFYTYYITMGDAMEACGRRGIPLVVLDRPNPLGGEVVEGPLLRERFRSGVGRYCLPVRYGLTPYELARFIVAECGMDCEVQGVPLQGWRRSMMFQDTGLPWVMPSPNIPTPDAAITYQGTCIFEGTNVSEGRGTTRPFELVGAPFLDASTLAQRLNARRVPGVAWRPVHFTPTFHKWAGKLCHGVQLHVLDRFAARPYDAGLWLFHEIREMAPGELTFQDHFFDALFGDDVLRTGAEEVSHILQRAHAEADEFRWQTRQYRVYPED